MQAVTRYETPFADVKRAEWERKRKGDKSRGCTKQILTQCIATTTNRNEKINSQFPPFKKKKPVQLDRTE